MTICEGQSPSHTWSVTTMGPSRARLSMPILGYARHNSQVVLPSLAQEVTGNNASLGYIYKTSMQK